MAKKENKDMTTNPAQRLFDILVAIKSYPLSRTIRQVWSDIFGINPDNLEQLLINITEVINLIESVKGISRFIETTGEGCGRGKISSKFFFSDTEFSSPSESRSENQQDGFRRHSENN